MLGEPHVTMPPEPPSSIVRTFADVLTGVWVLVAHHEISGVGEVG